MFLFTLSSWSPLTFHTLELLEASIIQNASLADAAHCCIPLAIAEQLADATPHVLVCRFNSFIFHLIAISSVLWLWFLSTSLRQTWSI